jgi:hypothetical protein
MVRSDARLVNVPSFAVVVVAPTESRTPLEDVTARSRELSTLHQRAVRA